jgi:hypothetical protein
MVQNKYCPTNLDTIVKNCKVLDVGKQSLLLKLLNKFKRSFDGKLGHWSTEPVDLELKQKHTKSLKATPCAPLSRENSKWVSKTYRVWGLQK